MRNPCFFGFKKLGLAAVLLALSFANLRAATGDDVNAGNPSSSDSGSNQALRAYLQLQEQIHDTQLAIERNRVQAQTATAQALAAAAQDSLMFSNRLHAIEQTMTFQRANDLEEAQRANHMLMGVLAIFATVGFAAVVLMVYFQSRAVSRLADISTALAARRGLPFPGAASLEIAERDTVSTEAVEQSNTRLVSLVQHLEKRIAELEHTATMPLKEPPTPSTNGGSESHPEITLNSSHREKSAELAKIMEKGQSLLTSDRPEEALACFDEVLAVEPKNAEALVKKGTAFEKMRQPQEALEYYDRAIAADNSLTIAYLHKGGLCSRLEKYGEAMECYERALHTQEKKQAA